MHPPHLPTETILLKLLLNTRKLVSFSGEFSQIWNKNLKHFKLSASSPTGACIWHKAALISGSRKANK